MSDRINADLLEQLHEACDHIEWLTRYVKTSESSNAWGVVANAREFLTRDEIKSYRLIREQIKARKAALAERDKFKK